MSSDPRERLGRTPLIALVDRANRAMQSDMVAALRAAGYDHHKPAHNAVFGTLGRSPARSADLAARAGITRQSMGEVVRELVGLGVAEMTPDPEDGRAKLVTWTTAGRAQSDAGIHHIADLEERLVDVLGAAGYDQLRNGLTAVIELLAAQE